MIRFYIKTVVVLLLFFAFLSNTYASDTFDIYIARGIEKINEKQFSEALEHMKKALEMAPEDTEALYYTALVYTRLGELEKAKELFLKIKDNESIPNINFELGRIYYVNEECSSAEGYLSRFISLSDDESLKTYAKTMIKDCYATKESDTEKRPYNLYISLGGQYDDNVVVEPDNPAVDSNDDKEDGNVVAFIAADAVLLNKGMVKLKADYNFYQSIHFDLDDYDLHYHKISPVLEIKINEAFMPSVGYSYEYTALGEEYYSGLNSFFVGLNIRENDNLSTDLTYKYSDVRYRNTVLFTSNSIRSGHQCAVGIQQNINIDKFSGDLHYFRECGRAKADYWSYDGDRAGANLMINIIPKLYLTIFGEYNENRYRDEYPGSDKKRTDRMQHYSLTVTYQVTDRFTVYLVEDYSDNDSNLSTFDYTRNIVSLFLTLSVL